MPSDPEGWVADPVASLEDLDRALVGAALLGLELDTRYRVLAATVEPVVAPTWGSGVVGPVEDARVQLLFSPVATVLASFRRRRDGRTEVLTFGEDQLVDVVAALDGPPLDAPLFGRPEPPPGSWAPRWSMEGRSSAPDGTARTVTVSVRHDGDADELALDLFARFDEVGVRDAAGTELLTLRPPGALGLDLDLG